MKARQEEVEQLRQENQSQRQIIEQAVSANSKVSSSVRTMENGLRKHRSQRR